MPDTIRPLLGEFLPDAQAIEFQEPPKSSRVTLYVLLALFITALLWASLANLDKVVSGRGRLVTPLPNLVVQPLEPGILKEIHVRMGQIVKKGAVLATLDPTFASADANQLGSRSDTLSIQARRLQSELRGNSMAAGGQDEQRRLQTELLAERRAVHAARLRQFEETIARLQAKRATNQQDQITLGQRLKSLQDLETMYADLEARQFGARAKTLEIQDRRLEVERDYRLAVNQALEIRQEIAAVEAEREGFAKSWRQEAMEKLSTTLQQRDEVDDQLSKARLRSEMMRLVAPEDSVVLEIGKKSVGSVVREAEPLFVLVPLKAALEAEVEIDPADVGDIRVGDKTRVKLDAYPFQKHGALEGRVASISADAFSRQGGLTGAPAFYYLARVRIDSTKLRAVPEPTHLIPGMTAAGEIITGKRSVISYFTYPIIRTFDESLREP